MTISYTQFIETLHFVTAEGYTAEKLVITEDSIEEFFSDEMLPIHKEMSNDVDEFKIEIHVSDDGNYLVTESGEEFDITQS